MKIDELKTDTDYMEFIEAMEPGDDISLKQWNRIVLKVLQILSEHIRLLSQEVYK